jgi:hypothetical protein
MRIEWHPEEITAEIEKEAIRRLEAAAAVIRDKAKVNLSKLVTGLTPMRRKGFDKYLVPLVPWKEHGPYKTGKSSGQSWTARYHDKMVETIRLSPHDVNVKTLSVRIIAGNYNTWWAKQMEYGNGEWRGGAKPFMRPAMRGARSEIQSVLESGAGQSNI